MGTYILCFYSYVTFVCWIGECSHLMHFSFTSYVMLTLMHKLQIGVYHEGKIRLVKCSSPYSQQFEHINLSSSQEEDESKANYTRKLKWNVRLGVWFHFSKFYIILMPFYCGVQKITIPLSMICGSLFGCILMWAVFGKCRMRK